MVLGAGHYQVPLIQAVREMGHMSCVVGRDDGSPGIAMADVFLPIDFMDYESVLRAAREHEIAGVCSASTDLTVPIIGRLVDDLHLPGFGSEIAFRTTNKVAMKKAFQEFGVPTAMFRIVSSIDEARQAVDRIGYPVMVKAVDTMGGRGITQVCEPEDLAPAWMRAMEATRSQEVVVEEYLEGLEFGAQALMFRGEIRYVVPHSDTVSPPPYCSPLGHAFPMSLDELGVDMEAVRQASKAGMLALGIDSGHGNMDFIHTSDGIRVLEIGARVGATCLPESTSIYTGMKVYQQVIDLALGNEPNCEGTASQPNAALYVEAPATGVLREVAVPPWVQEDPDVYRLTMYAKPGDPVRTFTVSGDRIGEVIVRGPTAEDAMAKARKIAKAIAETMTIEVA